MWLLAILDNYAAGIIGKKIPSKSSRIKYLRGPMNGILMPLWHYLRLKAIELAAFNSSKY